MDKFRKRRYRDLFEFIDDLKFLIKNRQKNRDANQDKIIS